MIWRGFRFGMVLQLAIGPVCAFIFQTAVTQGVGTALLGVLGTAIVDGTEIALAILGVGALITRSKRASWVLKYCGAAILILFGATYILGSFGIDIFPSFAVIRTGNVLVYSILLALSNPLTIVFWAAIFSAKITDGTMERQDLAPFGVGCILATLSFLSLVAVVGNVTKLFLPEMAIVALNVAVGIFMIAMAVKNLRTPLATQ